MSNVVSPNMNLIIPGVGAEAGPDYALDVNSSLTLIDQHDHSIGKGVQITPAGININTDLPFNSNSALSLLNVAFTSQSTATTTLQALSVAPGGESPAIQDLWYTDSMGNKVQITSGGELAPVTAEVSGITYASGTFSFRDTQDSLPTTPANLDAGSITIHPTTPTGATQGATLTLPSSLPSSVYDLTLPLVPSSSTGTSFLTIDSSGNIVGSVPENQGITRSMLATGAVAPVNTNAKTSNYSVLTTDDYIETSGTMTITLYAVTSLVIGRRLTIRKVDNTLLVTTINTTSSSLTTLNTIGESVDLIINQSGNWVVVNRTIPADLTAYTPTFGVGFGTVTAINFWSERRGNSLRVFGSFAAGTVFSSQANFTLGFSGVNLPTGLAINTSVVRTTPNSVIGDWVTPNTANSFGYVLANTASSTAIVFFSLGGSSGNITNANNMGGSGGIYSLECEVPIQGWNS
jgi:hypothetical protein